jgi:hypothetical protein
LILVQYKQFRTSVSSSRSPCAVRRAPYCTVLYVSCGNKTPSQMTWHLRNHGWLRSWRHGGMAPSLTQASGVRTPAVGLPLRLSAGDPLPNKHEQTPHTVLRTLYKYVTRPRTDIIPTLRMRNRQLESAFDLLGSASTYSGLCQ